jgi:long-chain acyl-CoA synthetase
LPTIGFWKLAAEDPSRVAVIDADGRTHTRGALLAAANQIVHALRARGVRRGDAVAAVLGNEVAILEMFMAAWQAGWYLTPINGHLAAPEIAYILGDCEAKAVVCSERAAEVTKKAVDALGFPEDMRFTTGRAPGFASFADLKRGQPETLPDDRTAGATMTYTSGTTGKPKGVRRPLAPVAPDVVGEANAMFLALLWTSGRRTACSPRSRATASPTRTWCRRSSAGCSPCRTT